MIFNFWIKECSNYNCVYVPRILFFDLLNMNNSFDILLHMDVWSMPNINPANGFENRLLLYVVSRFLSNKPVTMKLIEAKMSNL